MSMTTTRRKRARKACIPCHQRKRKCDGGYPCGTCTTYEYNCSYAFAAAADDNTTGPQAKRASRAATISPNPGSPSQVPVEVPVERSTDAGEADDLSAKSPTTLRAGASASTATNTNATPAGIFDEHDSRYAYAGESAAMAFPHILGRILGSNSPSKTHSLAYNFGIRPDEASSPHVLLGTLISEDHLGFFSRAYFSALAPIGDYLDPRIYARRCRHYYHGSGSSMVAFGAVAAGVAALGSFLSPDRHPRESDLPIDHIVAWAMRVLYLRATSRPNNAWIASCTMMHLCEAVGLHEEESIDKMASAADAAVVGHDADRLRRIFWISWAGHNLLSYEYDRSAVRFRAVTCQAITPTPGSVADQFVQIAQIIPAPNSPFRLECQPPTPREELCERLKALEKLPFTHPFLVVTKADLAFCFYRRIYQLKSGIPDDTIKLVIDSGSAAVDAAQQLANQSRLFWNVIGSVFQYTCVLLVIDTPAASLRVAAAFKGLENLVKTADTGPTREALSVARHLLRLNAAKKRKELAQLEAIEAGFQFFQVQPNSGANAAVPEMGWEMDWEQFFVEPYLSMFGPDV